MNRIAVRRTRDGQQLLDIQVRGRPFSP